MKASGKIIASMGTVFINSLTAATTGEIGWTTKNTGRESIHTATEISTRGNSHGVWSTAREHISIVLVISILESTNVILSTVTGDCASWMAISILAFGRGMSSVEGEGTCLINRKDWQVSSKMVNSFHSRKF
jgi:hypothetical protein